MSAAASDARPDGYEVPVVAALTEPVLMAGVPRDYAILMGPIAAVLGLALTIWWAVAHAAGLWAARQDKLFLIVLRRHLALPDQLDA
jgi:type IV secretion system protein VirB3